MTRERFGRRCIPVSVVVLISVCALLIGAVSAPAATAASAVAAPGSNMVSASVASVQPAVRGLFQVRSPRVWADEIDESGKLGKNSVPDFLDTWEAFRSRTSSASLDGKSYAFTTIDGLGHEVLYAGVQRASSAGPSEVNFEFNQKTGARLVGDLRIGAEIDAAGNVGTARFESYAGEEKGTTKFLSLAILSGEGCNDAGTACIVSNGALLEVGINLGQLSGESTKRFAGIQIAASSGNTIGTFAIVNPDTCDPATNPACPFYDVCVKEAPLRDLQNPPCTANDVQLTEILEGFTAVLADNDGGIGCDGESDADDPKCVWIDPDTGLVGDCVTFTARGRYVITTQSRYDIGTFIGIDADADGDGAISGQCLRYGYSLTDTTNLEPGTLDICGDLTIALAAAPTGKTVDFGPITVPCIADDDGNIVINHCETWAQRADEIDCRGSDDVYAGTGSKCNCGVLSGICIAVNSGNACTTNVCQGTCQNATGGSSTTPPTTCESNADCTVTGEACREIVLTSNPNPACDDSNACTTDTCDPDDGCVFTDNSARCDDSSACTTDSCVPATGCVNTTISCDDSNACTADSCVAATGCVNTDNSSRCDDGDFCTADSCVAATGCVNTDNSSRCADTNECTDDSCVPATGCVNAFNSAPCTADNNQCSLDQCVNGVCTAGAGGCGNVPEP